MIGQILPVGCKFVIFSGSRYFDIVQNKATCVFNSHSVLSIYLGVMVFVVLSMVVPHFIMVVFTSGPSVL